LLESANIKLASTVTHTMGKSGQAMLDAIVSGEDSPERLADLALGKLRSKIPQLQLALDGRIRDHHRFLLDRRGATVHNARGAFVAGLAMASELFTFVLKEGFEQQPIDYRDVVQRYTDDAQIQHLVAPFIKQIYDTFQSTKFVPITLPLRALETLDLGDVAAENEINALKSYFLPTAQYNDAKRGHARLVVGRKGAGKTAIFYGVRNAFWSSASHVVLDLKPEGHQFLTLREHFLDSLSKGMQEHVLTALWNYLLLIELAAKIVDTDGRPASKTLQRFELYDKLVQILGPEVDAEQGDFSERLLTLVDSLLARKAELGSISSPGDVTRLIYQHDIRDLQETLSS
jgi:hypothetical protein